MNNVAVVGLGYVGLSVVQGAAHAGMKVYGYETDAQRVSMLAAGVSYIDDLSDADVVALLAAGFCPTADAHVLAEVDVIVVCVPTPIDDQMCPDLSAVEAAGRRIAAYLSRGTVVILESTTYPGTTEELFRDVLEESGLTAGTDFGLVFSPERIDPGNREYGMRNTPKLIGGLTPQCADGAARFYEKFVDKLVFTRRPREAEMAKLLEATYRYVNIALVAELAEYCHGLDIDVWDVLDAAATKPFGYSSFRPGPGIGGHCIAVDPYYLSSRLADRNIEAPLLAAAHRVNQRTPSYLVERLTAMLGGELAGRNIVLLGVTYKADISDTRESPAGAIASLLMQRGAKVSYHDPYVTSWQLDGSEVPRADLAEQAGHVAVIVQPHSAYDLDEICSRASLVFDLHGKVRSANVVPL